MALFKNNTNDQTETLSRFNAKGYSCIYKKDIEIFRKTFKNVADISSLNIIKRNDNFYVIPEIDLDFEHLNIVSPGVLMGSLINGTFKIAHEFYHSYGDLFDNKVELDDNQLKDYLRGYELDIDTQFTGICAVYHMGVSVGGGKVSNGKLKNYYPKNLRIN